MTDWKQQEIEHVKQRLESAITSSNQRHDKYIESMKCSCELKIRLINALRKRPANIFGNTDIFIRTDDHLLVHDIAKELHIKLNRTGESDGFNFRGKHGDIGITVFGMQTVPHCKIVPRKKMQEVTVYDVICNDVVEQR